MTEHDQIELRSEKVKHLIGEIPSALLRNGIGIVCVLMMMLFFSLYFIPYPDLIKVDAVVKQDSISDKQRFAEALLPAAYRNRISQGTPTQIEFKTHSEDKRIWIKGEVSEIGSSRDHHPEKSHFTIKSSLPNTHQFSPGKRVTISILLTDKTIWEHFFHPTNPPKQQ